MVFKSFAAIARHSALAKHLFVASTATSAQPAFFVSTQQLARQQATAQAQQLISRSVQHSFSSGPGSSSSGSHPSANGAAFPSYAPSYNAGSLSVSTSSASDDDRRRDTLKNSPVRTNAVYFSDAHILSSPNTSQIRTVSVSRRIANSDDSSSVHSSSSADSEPSSFDDRVDTTGFITGERLVEVDDATAADIIAANEQHQQVQVYKQYYHFQETSQPKPQSEDTPKQELSSELPTDPFIFEKLPKVEYVADPIARFLAEDEAVMHQYFLAKDYETVINIYSDLRSKQKVLSLSGFRCTLESIANMTARDQVMSNEHVQLLLDTYLYMIQNNVIPNAETYAVVINALTSRYLAMRRVALNRPGRSSSQLAPQLGEQLAETDPSLKLALDVFFASTVVRVQAYPIWVYNRLLECLAATQQTKQAISVFKALESAVEQGKVAYLADTFVHLMRVFQTDVNAALEIYEFYKSLVGTLADRKELEIYSELLRVHLKSGDDFGGLELLERIIALPSFDITTMFTPLADIVIEHFTTASPDGRERAWLWLSRMLQDGLPLPSPVTIGKLLSACSLSEQYLLADEVYDCLLNRSDIGRAESAVSNYFIRLVSDDTVVGAQRLLAVLEDVLTKNLRVDLPMVRKAGVYLLKHPFSNEDMAHQAFMFLQIQVAAMPELQLQTRGPAMAESNALLVATLTDMLNSVNWSAIEDADGLMRRAYSVACPFDFDRIAISAPQPPVSLQTLFAPAWTRLANNEPIPLEDFDAIVFLHARAVVALPLSEFSNTVVKHLSALLSIAAEAGIILSPESNHYVTLAAPRLTQSFAPAPPTPVSAPPAPQPNPVAQTMQAEDAGVDEAMEAAVRTGRLQFDEQESEAVEHCIQRKTQTPAQLMDSIEQLYGAGLRISTEVSMKMIEYAGEGKDVAAGERMFALFETTVPPVHERPALYHVWKSVYSAMIKMYFQCQERDSLAHKKRLVEFKNKLIEIGSAPDANAYGNFIVKLKAAGSHDEAREACLLFNEALAYGIYPTTFLYNALLSKLSKARKYKLALMYFREMEEYRLKRNSVTYGTMISASCRAEDIVTAEQLLVEMEALPNYRPRVAPYNTILQYYIFNLKDRAKALKFFDSMKQRPVELTPHSYTLLISAYTRIEPVDMDGAREAMKTIERDGYAVKSEHCAALIAGFGGTEERYDLARKLFDDFISSGRVTPDVSLYQQLIEACIASGRLEETTEILKDMESRDVTVSVYVINKLIEGWAQTNLAVSQSFFDIAYTNGIAGPSTYEAMITANLAHGKVAAAEQVLDLFVKQNYPDPVLAGAKNMIRECRWTLNARNSAKGAKY
ncbi:hypothetical protein BZA70DRAFT_148149 [Myxozyma melibiosi]|uniref:Pentacotripeptide-repeat region of PRORP domain-containing protein n=1 Tax=Myxozyma melibiosi TaxID=54550 RepID=A0ABR1F7X3_9ASCO